MNTAAIDPRALIDKSPMTWRQIQAVAILFALNALDGFDVLAIAFAAPGITAEWGITRAALGVVISAGLIGMTIGSLVIASLADSFGRRPVILGCLILMTAGMFLTATSNDVSHLVIWRVLTGLGIGGMLGSLNAMTAEYSNARNRTLCISLMAIGYPLGTVLGGLVSAYLMSRYDWRAVFVFGGIANSIFIVLVLWRLPESIEFLTYKRRGSGDLETVNRVLGFLKQQQVSALPAPRTESSSFGILDLLRSKLLPVTLFITAIYFLHILSFYYFLTWLPQIMSDVGFDIPTAIRTSVIASIGGIVGGLIFAYIVRVLGLSFTIIVLMLFGGVMLVVFSNLGPDLMGLRIAAFFAGMALSTPVNGIYVLMAQQFPVHARSSGTGFVIGVGRGGGILAPMIAGLLFSNGLSLSIVSAALAAGTVLAAVVLAIMHFRLLSGRKALE